MLFRSIAGGSGVWVRCISGLLWVTQEGDARDYILPGGLMFHTSAKGLIVVRSMEGASIIAHGQACAPGTRDETHPRLRIAWESFHEFERAARHARNSHAVAVLCSVLRTARRVGYRLLQRLAGAESARRKSETGDIA